MESNSTVTHTGPAGWIFSPGEGWKYVGEVGTGGASPVSYGSHPAVELQGGPVDSIVLKVLQEHVDRASKGFTKYNATLDRTDLSVVDYLQHAKEEAMDLALYLEKAIQLLGGKQSNTGG